MTCTFCRRRITKTAEGFWSDGQHMPTFCGHSAREAGHRYHEPELNALPLIKWEAIEAASRHGVDAQIKAWPRVLERLRSAELSCLLLFVALTILTAINITTLLWR